MNKIVKKEIWNKTKGKCWYCGIELNPWDNLIIFKLPADEILDKTEDGIDPFTLTLQNDNLRKFTPVCEICCRERKRNKSLEEFRCYKIAKIDNFNYEQKEYLKKINAKLTYPSYIFYFERLSPYFNEDDKNLWFLTA